jgi:hypothetical protein
MLVDKCNLVLVHLPGMQWRETCTKFDETKSHENEGDGTMEPKK